MAASKTARTLGASASLAATASRNETEWNLSAAYGGIASVKLSLSGSAPTTVPVIKFYTGESIGTKRLFYTVSGSTTTGDYPLDFNCVIPPSAMFVNITITNGATNAITVESFGQELTTI
jgi:hypothetical protein